MIPAEWLKRLRQVEVRSRLVSEQLLGGRMNSIFKGRGMDFADVKLREDIRVYTDETETEERQTRKNQYRASGSSGALVDTHGGGALQRARDSTGRCGVVPC